MKRILITGAGRGLGFEFTRQCLIRGDKVFAGARRPEESPALQELAAKYPELLRPVRLDVTAQASIETSWETVREQTDGLDLLINNAGVNSMSKDSVEPASHLQLGRLDPERMLDMFHINTIAPMMMVQHYLDLLKAGQEPRIVNISSWLGSLTIKTQGGNYSYCASKTALNMLTRCLAFDVLQMGIVAVMVNPGWVQTDMGGARAALTPEQSVHGLLRVIDGLTPTDAGRFIQWNGTEHPW